ncbi:DUF6020 family protein [Butyrivibrio sp. VCB2006]|uniref:DUF6020 family protein n=1 Tax=Butyrivibrio sp. VCB2006 TaxID=1280679 RepID=UPI000492BC9F|nr:DUF6020 family protein [Butyrivibrio sp. VCB2006]
MEKSELGKLSVNTNNKSSKIAWLLSGLFGVLSAIFIVWGYQLEKADCINLSDQNSLLVLVLMILVFTIDTKHIWDNYTQSFHGRKFMGTFRLENYFKKVEDPVRKNDFWINWAVLVALTLPVLLGVFPGFFVYDAQDELMEVITRSFTTHHPLLHVLFLGGTIALVHKFTGSWNAGIATYIIIQMLIITAVFAYVITYMRKKGVSRKGKIVWILYYGLFPTIVMFTLCSCKDGLFSALMVLLTVYLIQMTEDIEGFLGDKRKVAAVIFVATLLPCFRHNGFYAYLVFVPFALVYFRKQLKSVLVPMLVLPIVLYLIISTVLSAALGCQGTHNQEKLTVPIMQMARVYTYDRDSMTQDEIDTLKEYIPETNLDLYTPRVSDLVKVAFNNDKYDKDSHSFWKLWFSLLKKHPMTYLNSWMLTSYGYWYPAANINVYKETTVFTFTYEKSSYFGYEVEQPGERTSLIPAIDELYRYLSIGSLHEDNRVLSLLFSPGLLFIVYLFAVLYRLSQGNFKRVLPFVPLCLTWLTVLLGPTYLPRYVLYLWTCLPLLAVTGSVTDLIKNNRYDNI